MDNGTVRAFHAAVRILRWLQFAFSEPEDGEGAHDSSSGVDAQQHSGEANVSSSSKNPKMFDIVQQAFEEVLGEAAGKGLASRLSPSMVNDPAKLENELRRLLGYGADIIIDAVRSRLAAAHITLPLVPSSFTPSQSSSNIIASGDNAYEGSKKKSTNKDDNDETSGKTQFIDISFIAMRFAFPIFSLLQRFMSKEVFVA
jgi:hypothetical protein